MYFRKWKIIVIVYMQHAFFLFSLCFIPFTYFLSPLNFMGTVHRRQADKCTETLLAFNLLLDKCKYCCQWYWSPVQQSSEELAHPFFTLCPVLSVAEDCDPEYSFLMKTIELSHRASENCFHIQAVLHIYRHLVDDFPALKKIYCCCHKPVFWHFVTYK